MLNSTIPLLLYPPSSIYSKQSPNDPGAGGSSRDTLALLQLCCRGTRLTLNVPCQFRSRFTTTIPNQTQLPTQPFHSPSWRHLGLARVAAARRTTSVSREAEEVPSALGSLRTVAAAGSRGGNGKGRDVPLSKERR